MKQVLCFGDSNTWGLVAGTEERYSRQERWTGILQEKLSGGGIRIVEEGLCGRTTIYEDMKRAGLQGATVLPMLLKNHLPDLTVIMLGTNDCKAAYRASAWDIGQGAEILLNQVKRYAPGSRILLISPIFLGEQVWRAEYDPEFNENSVMVSRQLRQVYEGLAGKHQVEFLAASDYAKPSPVDMEHLEKKGHEKLADAIYQKVREIFSYGQVGIYE